MCAGWEDIGLGRRTTIDHQITPSLLFYTSEGFPPRFGTSLSSSSPLQDPEPGDGEEEDDKKKKDAKKENAKKEGKAEENNKDAKEEKK